MHFPFSLFISDQGFFQLKNLNLLESGHLSGCIKQWGKMMFKGLTGIRGGENRVLQPAAEQRIQGEHSGGSGVL